MQAEDGFRLTRTGEIAPPSGAGTERLYAGLLLSVLILLFIAGVWGTYFNGINGWVITARILFVLVVLSSLLFHRPDWRAIGFRFDNFGAVWNRATLAALAVLSIVLVAALAAGYPVVPLSPSSAVTSLLSGLAQQAIVVGYFFPLWEAALKRAVPAAVANSILFGAIHLPDAALVILAGVGSLILHLIFLRGRNVYVIGMAHGVLAVLLIPMLLSHDLMKTPKIGPSELLPFSRRILRESGSNARVGICSLFVGGNVFRDSFNRPVRRIFRGSDDDQRRRQRMLDFLAADERAYCVITDRELRSLSDASVEKRAYRLAHGWIWRKERGEEEPRESVGQPFLEVFLERVTLLSNQPSSDR